MSRNIVIEGWLTKSPPNRRIFRTKWRRRWFTLRQSSELPGQYFLDYFADRNCRRYKGTIDLDLCEQVDAGLHMERGSQAHFDPNIRGSVFTIQTQQRIYHLEADCESDMEKWVDAICQVCGLRSSEDANQQTIDSFLNSATEMTTMNQTNEGADGTGPYIPISECITGLRAQDEQRAFTFDPKKIVVSRRHEGHSGDAHHPLARTNNSECSENDSNMSDEEESLQPNQQNLPHWSVSRTFTKLSVSPKRNGGSEVGPPVPPRPPKTFTAYRSVPQRDSFVPPKETFQGPRIQEPVEAQDNVQYAQQQLRSPRRSSQGAPTSPSRFVVPIVRVTDDEEESAHGHPSMQYYNLPALPPAIDRALKPRHSSHSVGHIYTEINQGIPVPADEPKPDGLQYLDLDLPTSKPMSKGQPRKSMDLVHGKSASSGESESVYKTVDFLKTEAFNITRQDAEASRSFQC